MYLDINNSLLSLYVNNQSVFMCLGLTNISTKLMDVDYKDVISLYHLVNIFGIINVWETGYSLSLSIPSKKGREDENEEDVAKPGFNHYLVVQNTQP